MSNSADQWNARLEHVDVDFVCVGHTHVPMHLELKSTQVVNPGSVGQPRDGDPRAAYAIIDDGQVELHRIEYDIDRTIAHMRSAEIAPNIIHQAESILRNGGAQDS